MWLYGVICGLYVVIWGYTLLYVAISGYLWLYVVIKVVCGYC